ncbi:hypothetical protein D3C87_1398600 [compost metagenome]
MDVCDLRLGARELHGVEGVELRFQRGALPFGLQQLLGEIGLGHGGHDLPFVDRIAHLDQQSRDHARGFRLQRHDLLGVHQDAHALDLHGDPAEEGPSDNEHDQRRRRRERQPSFGAGDHE